jgi:hypothetical protein
MATQVYFVADKPFKGGRKLNIEYDMHCWHAAAAHQGPLFQSMVNTVLGSKLNFDLVSDSQHTVYGSLLPQMRFKKQAAAQLTPNAPAGAVAQR